MTAAAYPRRIFLSLGLRVAVPIVLLVLTVAAGVYLGLVRQSKLTLLNSKEVAADMVVKLTSVSFMPAVVFGDEEEMQRAIDNLAKNPDVSDVELWGFEDSVLGASEGLLAKFRRPGGRPLWPARDGPEPTVAGSGLHPCGRTHSESGEQVGCGALRSLLDRS